MHRVTIKLKVVFCTPIILKLGPKVAIKLKLKVGTLNMLVLYAYIQSILIFETALEINVPQLL